MGVRFVQDSDAESSDSSPARPTALPPRHDLGTAGQHERAGGPALNSTTQSKVRIVRTTMERFNGGIQGGDPSGGHISSGEKRPADLDEDEVDLVRQQKRTKRNATGLLELEPAYPLHVNTMELDGSASLQDQLVSAMGEADEGEKPNAAPDAPHLCNDLSFSSIAPSTVAYANSQISTRNVSPAKWFPALESENETYERDRERIGRQDPAVSEDADPTFHLDSDQVRKQKDNPKQATRPAEGEKTLTEDLQPSTGAHSVETEVSAPTEDPPKKRKRGRPRKIQDASPAEAQPSNEETTPLHRPARKSASRKRGRKQQEGSQEEEMNLESESTATTAEETRKTAAEVTTHDETTGPPQTELAENQDSGSMTPSHEKAAPNDDEKENNAQSTTPTKDSGSNSTAKHSPIRNGKVPYRVGLSKRARIEPLLRIVKK